jgi:hypothetical protein
MEFWYMGHFINNAQGGKTAEWIMQSQWKLSVTVEDLRWAAHVFVTSLVYTVLNWQVLRMASAGALGTVTVEDQRSYV